jgi:hypothetical protein
MLGLQVTKTEAHELCKILVICGTCIFQRLWVFEYDSAYPFLRNAETDLKIRCPVPQWLVCHTVNATRENSVLNIQHNFWLLDGYEKWNSYCLYNGNFCSCGICIKPTTERKRCSIQGFVIMQFGAWPLYGMLELQTTNVVSGIRKPSPLWVVGGNNRHRSMGLLMALSVVLYMRAC